MARDAILFMAVAIFASACVITVDDDRDDDIITTEIIHDEYETNGDVTWAEGVHVLREGLTVRGGTLTVEPCSVIKMPNDNGIFVSDYGAIDLRGTPDCPILITSSKPTPSAGDWAAIEIDESADNGNVLDNVIVEYGGTGLYGMFRVWPGASVAVTNTVFQHSETEAVVIHDGATLGAFTGNVVKNNGKGVVAGSNMIGLLGEGVYGPNDREGIWIAEVEETLTEDAVWADHGVPYQLVEGLYLDGFESGSAVLTVGAGCELRMGASSVLAVGENAGFMTLGTPTDHVVITSAKSVPAPGDWDEIDLGADSMDAANALSYTDIRYGGGSFYGQLYLAYGAGVTFDNVTFSDSGYNGGCDIEGDWEATITETSGSVNVYYDCRAAE